MQTVYLVVILLSVMGITAFLIIKYSDMCEEVAMLKILNKTIKEEGGIINYWGHRDINNVEEFKEYVRQRYGIKI